MGDEDEDEAGGEVEVDEEEEEEKDEAVVAWLVVGDVTTGEEGVIRCSPIARQFLGASFKQRDLSSFSDAESEAVILGVMIIVDAADEDDDGESGRFNIMSESVLDERTNLHNDW